LKGGKLDGSGMLFRYFETVKLILCLGIYTFTNGERYDGKYKEGKRSGKVYLLYSLTLLDGLTIILGEI